MFHPLYIPNLMKHLHVVQAYRHYLSITKIYFLFTSSFNHVCREPFLFILSCFSGRISPHTHILTVNFPIASQPPIGRSTFFFFSYLFGLFDELFACTLDLKTIVQLCADPEDVGDTLAKIAASKVKQLADFQDMTNDDLETTVKDIPTGIKSKLRKALLPYIAQGI